MEINNAQFAKITRTEYGSLAVSEYNSKELYILGTFLTFEIDSDGMAFGFFLDWLIGKYKQEKAEGNVFGLIEYQGKILAYMQSHICGKKPYGKNASITFSINREQMINIMGDWAYIMSQTSKPNTILITQEGGNVQFAVLD